MNPLLEKKLYIVKQFTVLATDIFQLTLSPEIGTEIFSFVAGQWIYVYLLNDDGSEWGRAAFSIASEPSATNNQIELAIKVHGDFTKHAQQLVVGARVHIQGPFGVFTLKTAPTPIVMCAGGIGVTPFRCMIRELIAQKDSRHVTLFYSNSTRAETAYLDELTELASEHSQFTLVLLFTREQVGGAIDHRIDSQLLSQYVQDSEEAEYLTCGPRPFMDAVAEALIQLGLDPKKKLKKEIF